MTPSMKHLEMLTFQKREYFQNYLVKEERLQRIIKISLPYLELIPENFDFVDFVAMVYSAPYRYLVELKQLFSTEWFKSKVQNLNLLPYQGKTLRCQTENGVVGFPIASYVHYNVKLLLGCSNPQALDIEDFKTVPSSTYLKINKRGNYKFEIANGYRFKHKQYQF